MQKENWPVVPDTMKHSRYSNTTDASNQYRNGSKPHNQVSDHTHISSMICLLAPPCRLLHRPMLSRLSFQQIQLGLFEDPEIQKLFHLMQTAAPSVGYNMLKWLE